MYVASTQTSVLLAHAEYTKQSATTSDLPCTLAVPCMVDDVLFEASKHRQQVLLQSTARRQSALVHVMHWFCTKPICLDALELTSNTHMHACMHSLWRVYAIQTANRSLTQPGGFKKYVQSEAMTSLSF